MWKLSFLFKLAFVAHTTCSANKLFALPKPPRFLRHAIVSSVIFSAACLNSEYSFAISDIDKSALENIVRVQQSLKYLNDDIEKGDKDAAGVVTNVKALIKNYKLKENLLKTYELVSNSKRSDAKSHGQAAVEDLTQIYEYYPDDLDNFTGARKASREVLTFALAATKAADNELQQLFQFLPEDITEAAKKTVKEEFQI